eukprot:TRINITY_DN82290_c0_g1_i1.p3 TRINITY_DN82290_c0_g1~~TRINITY_DN82290_c0_g1_i1.p3  ORF type:complete len:178 (+),score=7.08 TRINITY_DN82290_c0_g1_i1:242-775(+)
MQHWRTGFSVSMPDLLIHTEVNEGTPANSGRPGVLFDGGLGPPREGLEVAEVVAVVVVGVPKRVPRAGVEPGAEDAGPLGGGRVDAEMHLGLLRTRQKALEESLVARLGAPVLRAFDVEPEHAELGFVLAQIGYQGLNLLGTVSTLGAREHVHVDVRKSGSPRVLEIVENVGVNNPI